MTPPVVRAGVLGAGTMGAGIAQALAQAGVAVTLVDADAAALERGLERLTADLRRGAERGRWSDAEADAAAARVGAAGELEALAGCELVIEAVPERLDLKRELLGRLADVCGERTVLATNTSSLLVSEIAAVVACPERVVGLHFFNPAPLMRLVEVVPGLRTSSEVVELAVAVVEAMGKRPIVARDGIGFVVNRCARPFYGEALRLLAEGVATAEQIDRICRLGGGFRMGPFELIDLIGVDVNFAIARSFFEQSFGEPRWQPSPIQARLVAAGLHGRKSGRGFHDYAGGTDREPDPPPPARGGGDGRTVAVLGAGRLAGELRAAAAEAGFALAASGVGAWLVVEAEVDGDRGGAGEAPCAVLCARRGLARAGRPGAAGFHLAAPLADSALAELTRDARTDPVALERASAFFAALGLHREVVGDGPGLVLGRIVAQLVNEASFAVGEGVASAGDVDAAMTLGLNFPRGPLAWGAQLGAGHVLAVLDGLWEERRDPRYRTAPALLAPGALDRGTTGPYAGAEA